MANQDVSMLMFNDEVFLKLVSLQKNYFSGIKEVMNTITPETLGYNTSRLQSAVDSFNEMSKIGQLWAIGATLNIVGSGINLVSVLEEKGGDVTSDVLVGSFVSAAVGCGYLALKDLRRQRLSVSEAPTLTN